MIAYRINECDVYAANSLDEAILAAMADNCCARDEIFDETFLKEFAPDVKVKTDSEDENSYTTVGEILAGMDGSGLAFGFCD